jgi:hypothetical protein
MTKEFYVTYCPAEDKNNKSVESDLTNNSTIKKEYYATYCMGILFDDFKITRKATQDIGELSDFQFELFVAKLKEKLADLNNNGNFIHSVYLAEDRLQVLKEKLVNLLNKGTFLDSVYLADDHLQDWCDLMDSVFSDFGGFTDKPPVAVYIWEKTKPQNEKECYELNQEIEKIPYFFEKCPRFPNVRNIADVIRIKTDPSHVPQQPQPATPAQQDEQNKQITLQQQQKKQVDSYYNKIIPILENRANDKVILLGIKTLLSPNFDNNGKIIKTQIEQDEIISLLDKYNFSDGEIAECLGNGITRQAVNKRKKTLRPASDSKIKAKT